MAVLVEAISVIIKAEAVKEKYPGGWEAFRDNVPNGTLCADGELIRVGFMAPYDVQAYVESLEESGLRYIENGMAKDVVVADQLHGLAMPCEWCEFHYSKIGVEDGSVITACWLKGSTNRQVVTPDGWDYHDSISEKFQFQQQSKQASRMKFLRREESQDVYMDRETGKEHYVGRTI